MCRTEDPHAQEHATVLIVDEMSAAEPGDEFRRGLGGFGGPGRASLVAQPDLVACVQVLHEDVVGSVPADLGDSGAAPQDRRIGCQVHDDLLCFMPVEIIMNLRTPLAQRFKKSVENLSDHSASCLSESSGEVSSDWCS